MSPIPPFTFRTAKANEQFFLAANSGIGFELARQLIATEANHVLLGCRSEEKGEKAAQELRSMGLPGTVEPLLIDVVDEASVIAAVQKVESTHGR